MKAFELELDAFRSLLLTKRVPPKFQGRNTYETFIIDIHELLELR